MTAKYISKKHLIKRVLKFLPLIAIVIVPVLMVNVINRVKNDNRSKANESIDPTVAALTAKMYIAPITVLGHGANINDQELRSLLSKIGYGTQNAATGFSVGNEYTSDTYGQDRNFDLNPTGVNEAIRGAISYKLPLLVHANGYKWVPIHRFDNDRNVSMWDQNGKTYMDLPGYADMQDYNRAGSWLWSLNEFNVKYLSLKEKNFRQLARILSNFNKSHPDLFIGMSLDSEISMLAAAWYDKMYSYDYNPDTILQWKMYLAGKYWPTSVYDAMFGKKSPYIGSGKLSGKGLNLTLDEVNQRYGTRYTSYASMVPPRVDEGLVKSSGNKVFKPEQGTSIQQWYDWQTFKESMVHGIIEKMVAWAVEEGVPSSKVFSHQAVILGDGQESESAYWASTTKTPSVQGAGYGFDVYGADVRNTALIETVKKINPLWGVMEWNPMTTADTLSALNESWNYGAKVLCPNYFISTYNPGDDSNLNLNFVRDSSGAVIISRIADFLKEKSSQKRQISGFVDGWVGNNVTGWVCDLSESNRPLSIEFKNTEGKVIATGTADTPRGKTVADACNSSHQYHGFSVPITDSQTLSTRAITAVVSNPFTKVSRTISYSPATPKPSLSPTSTPAQTQPPDLLKTLGNSPSVLGWLDVADKRGVIGWTCDETQPGKQISVAVRYGKDGGTKIVETYTANTVRGDTIKGICKSSTGDHGYVIPIPNRMAPGDTVEVFGLDESGYVQLHGSPRTYNP